MRPLMDQVAQALRTKVLRGLLHVGLAHAHAQTETQNKGGAAGGADGAAAVDGCVRVLLQRGWRQGTATREQQTKQQRERQQTEAHAHCTQLVRKGEREKAPAERAGFELVYPAGLSDGGASAASSPHLRAMEEQGDKQLTPSDWAMQSAV